MNIYESLFDDWKYNDVLNLSNPYKKDIINSQDILYYLKAKLVLNDFDIFDEYEIKKLLFYYFYLEKDIIFDNWYKFSFKDNLNISFLSFKEDIQNLSKFHQYFDLGKNKIFLLGKKWVNSYIKIDNILDFFIQFLSDCAELYAFKWENQPLFKWIVRVLEED